jgi:hypothetical protein
MAEIAQMRGLLGEMGRLAACNRVDCAHVAEAPTKLEGIKDVYEAGRGISQPHHGTAKRV